MSAENGLLGVPEVVKPRQIPGTQGYEMPPLSFMNRKLQPINIYTAGPIDLGPDRDWRKELQQAIARKGISAVLFDPSAAYKMTFPGGNPENGTSKHCGYVFNVNKIALSYADLVIASVPSGVPIVGTAVEIFMCNQMNKSVWLVTDIPQGKSMYLDHMVPSDRRYGYHELEALANQLYIDCENFTYSDYVDTDILY